MIEKRIISPMSPNLPALLYKLNSLTGFEDKVFHYFNNRWHASDIPVPVGKLLNVFRFTRFKPRFLRYSRGFIKMQKIEEDKICSYLTHVDKTKDLFSCFISAESWKAFMVDWVTLLLTSSLYASTVLYSSSWGREI